MFALYHNDMSLCAQKVRLCAGANIWPQVQEIVAAL
jgi:hypothetical protein